jgi:hypothetical protein
MTANLTATVAVLKLNQNGKEWIEIVSYSSLDLDDILKKSPGAEIEKEDYFSISMNTWEYCLNLLETLSSPDISCKDKIFFQNKLLEALKT